MTSIACPNIIDIEASGFGAQSYPIEIGVSLATGGKYCSLIRPEPKWTHWDEKAEQTHNITQAILRESGKSSRVVAQELNQHLKGKVVYSDCWGVDYPWLIALFHAAQLEMDFHVSDIVYILSERQMSVWHEVKEQVITELNKGRHRASFDAQVIQETYLRTV